MTTNQIALRDVKTKERANQLREAELAESRRHNVETEGYTAEHYVRQDQASLLQAYASQSQAETAAKNQVVNMINAETNKYNAETSRLVYGESVRHNTASEAEMYRHNTATERQAINTLNEEARHNRASESNESSKIAESVRHNKATELQAENELAEDKRHHKADEAIGYINAGANATRAATDASALVHQIANDAAKLSYSYSELAQKTAYNEAQIAAAADSRAIERERLAQDKTISDEKLIRTDVEQAIKVAGLQLDALGLQAKYDYDHGPNIKKESEFILYPIIDVTERVAEKFGVSFH